MTALAVSLRQDMLKTQPNPNQGHDYLIQHDAAMNTAGNPVRICLRMIPDRHITDGESIRTYLTAFAASDAPLEMLASQILDDLLNTLIPRFLHIELIFEKNNHSHRIVMEEKQPKWNNQGLLDRLAAL